MSGTSHIVYSSVVGDERDIRLSFDGVAEVYDRARPNYPDSLFDVLFAALPSTPVIVEVGPGTGQATGSLLSRGATVTAIELGPHLAEFLEAKLSRPALRVIHASFENAEIPVGAFDAVFCATAYHWIGPEAQVHRPLELLKPGGLLAVLDLIQVDTPADRGYFERVQPIYNSFGQGDSNWSPKTHETAQPKIADHLRASGEYDSVAVLREPWDQTYSSTQYRDLLLSYSGTQMMDEPERSDMVGQLIDVVDEEFDGVLTRPLVATLTMARTR